MNEQKQQKRNSPLPKQKLCNFINIYKKLKTDITLYLSKKKLNQAKTIKLLGVILGQKINFKDHIQNLKIDCMKRLNMMKISNDLWGSDQKTLLYKTVIRSKIDYASNIYANTTKTVFKMFNPINN